MYFWVNTSYFSYKATVRVSMSYKLVIICSTFIYHGLTERKLNGYHVIMFEFKILVKSILGAHSGEPPTYRYSAHVSLKH